MKKITLILLIVISVSSMSSFAIDKKDTPKAKKAMKCSMGGNCCKKSVNKAAVLKTKAAVKKLNYSNVGTRNEYSAALHI